MDSNVLLLSQLSPYQIAQMIRALDSRLLGIEGENQGAVVRLIYSFAIAGGIQHFRVNVRGDTVPSIAAIYPAALGCSKQHLRSGLVSSSMSQMILAPKSSGCPQGNASIVRWYLAEINRTGAVLRSACLQVLRRQPCCWAAVQMLPHPSPPWACRTAAGHALVGALHDSRRRLCDRDGADALRTLPPARPRAGGTGSAAAASL